MTQEEQLLLADLCARLYYGVKCKDNYAQIEGKLCQIGTNYNMCLLSDEYGESKWVLVSNCKPYLLPLSSMTEEQKEEYCQLQQKVLYSSNGPVNADIMEFVNWCYENHIDINNLIPIGLAIDCTNLNIY